MASESYSLGVSDGEQARLHRQRELYGDTAGIEFSSTDVVCEIGSGVGANLWIAKQVARGRYVGIDVEPKQNEVAAKRAWAMGLKNTELRTASGDNTGLPDGGVDATFCRCVLIHQPDPTPLIAEMCRITKLGGRIIISEPHDASYHSGPDKTHLMKCLRARSHYAYGDGRGSPEVALNLYPLLIRQGVRDIRVTPHVISVHGREPERCRAFLQNWLGIIATVADSLLEVGAVSERDLDLAAAEAEDITANTFLYQSMWIAEAIK
ncbi:MAG: methyltransferase domain-containing protein [Gammaproteobacteria bacterium]|jgi:SAM-dependent methyltransferase|nr:methyltransferase domain-containing protein [Gammaproteobacteria bacterium]